tara:strand:- start:897 stop:1268 length:372 start_codon:yes stop_codon:yes gene_type:complete
MLSQEEQDKLNKEMHDTLKNINECYAAGVKIGRQQAFKDAQQIIQNVSSDPVKPPVTPVNTKKFTVNYDSVDQVITLRVGDDVRNVHHSNVPHLKFESALTLMKDMFAKWNAVLAKGNGNKNG